MKGNTMNKKLILTTALVSMLAVSANAELKIKGGMETTFGDRETASATAPSYQGAALGQETKFEFNHTKDLVGGWTSKLDMEVMEVAGTVADTEITIKNGDTAFYISKDGGSIMDQNTVPGAYNARPGDNISISNASLDGGTIHGVHNFGVSQKIDGFGKVELRYAPDVTNANAAGDKNTGAGGGSGIEYGFVGNLGIDGLKFRLATAETKNENASINEVKNYAYGVGYNFGSFAVGVERNDKEGSTQGTDETSTLYGVTFAASDSLTLGINIAEHDQKTTGTSEEEVMQIEVAYNLGGATVAFVHQQAENVGGTTDADADGYMITYKQSF